MNLTVYLKSGLLKPTLVSSRVYINTRYMKNNTAEFIISNSDVSKCPKDFFEYAFIGRSNVGSRL
jgi:hypothetical protein